MSNLPQVYRKYELLFTPHLIPQLRNLRGDVWAEFIDSLVALPENHPDTLAFSVMMISLGGCLPCERDNYRAQRGCALCSRQTILSFKGSDKKLIKQFEKAKQVAAEYLAQTQVQQVA